MSSAKLADIALEVCRQKGQLKNAKDWDVQDWVAFINKNIKVQSGDPVKDAASKLALSVV